MIQSEDIKIRIGDSFVSNFNEFQVVLSFEDVADTFSLRVWDIWTRNGSLCPYHSDDEVEIYVSGHRVLLGTIESLDYGYSESEYWVSMTGKSEAGQIVDCSSIYEGSVWNNVALLRIAQDLCEPIGVTVKVDDSLSADRLFNEKFPKFSVEHGEMIMDTLGRACRMRGAMMTTDRISGGLLLTRASDTVTMGTIRGGVLPVVNGSRQGTLSLRYSNYFIKGQTSGKDVWFGDKASKGRAVVTDAEVQRYRPLVIIAEGHGGTESLRRRAEWERNVRAGKSKRVTYTMAGWRDFSGNLWDTNQNIRVTDPFLDIDDTLLIVRVTLMLGDNGVRTGLELCHKNAFLPEETPPKPKRNKKRSSNQSVDKPLEGLW